MLQQRTRVESVKLRAQRFSHKNRSLVCTAVPAFDLVSLSVGYITCVAVYSVHVQCCRFLAYYISQRGRPSLQHIPRKIRLQELRLSET